MTKYTAQGIKVVAPDVSLDYAWTGNNSFSQPVLFPNGSAALPSVAFSNDPDTGIYRFGSNSLGVSTGGTNRLELTSGGQWGFSRPDSAVSLMSLSPHSTADALGIFSQAGSGNVASMSFFATGSREYKVQSRNTGGSFVIRDETAGVDRYELTSSGVHTFRGNPLVTTANSGDSPEIRFQRTAGTTTDWEIYCPSGAQTLRFFNSTLGGNVVTFAHGGGVRFDTYGAGTLQTDASGNITAVSDERAKRQVRPFSRGMVAVRGIEPILHGYAKASGLDQSKNDYAGFSAQNVRKFIPEAVGTDTHGFMTLSINPLLAALVNATKELDTRIAALESA